MHITGSGDLLLPWWPGQRRPAARDRPGRGRRGIGRTSTVIALAAPGAAPRAPARRDRGRIHVEPTLQSRRPVTRENPARRAAGSSRLPACGDPSPAGTVVLTATALVLCAVRRYAARTTRATDGTAQRHVTTMGAIHPPGTRWRYRCSPPAKDPVRRRSRRRPPSGALVVDPRPTATSTNDAASLRSLDDNSPPPSRPARPQYVDPFPTVVVGMPRDDEDRARGPATRLARALAAFLRSGSHQHRRRARSDAPARRPRPRRRRRSRVSGARRQRASPPPRSPGMADRRANPPSSRRLRGTSLRTATTPRRGVLRRQVGVGFGAISAHAPTSTRYAAKAASRTVVAPESPSASTATRPGSARSPGCSRSPTTTSPDAVPQQRRRAGFRSDVGSWRNG